MDSESVNVEETACPICRKTFKSQTSLNGHLQCHNFKSGQFRFPCDYSCGESFDNLAQLWKHKRFHEQKNRPYVCDLCSRAFERRSQLKYHQEKSHDEKRPHTCKKCDKRFYKKSDLSSHTKLHLGLKEHSCRYCYRKFAHISNLNRHILTHKKEKPYSCEICGQRYPQLATLNQHLKRHDGIILPQSNNKPRQRQFHCKYCHQKFPHKADLIQHQSEHAKELYPYTCKRCKKGFARLTGISLHECAKETINNVPETFYVARVTQQEQIPSQLQYKPSETNKEIPIEIPPPPSQPVVVKETDVQPAETDVSAIITKDVILKDHNIVVSLDTSHEILHLDSLEDLTVVQVDESNWILGHHSSATEEILHEIEVPEAEEAKIQYFSLTTDQVHDQIIPTAAATPNTKKDNKPIFNFTAEKVNGVYVCTKCNKKFNRRDSLKQHYGMHVKEFALKCSVCNLTFGWASTLRRHREKVHEFKKAKAEFKCDLCKLSFKTKVHLKVHKERDHFNIRPHKCDYCDKAFYTKDSWTVHQRFHTGEKPIKCRICDKTFRYRSHRARHERENHDERKPYKCDVCKMSYDTEKSLNNHTKKSHPI